MFSGSWEAQSGTIYPILSKLESQKKMLIGEDKKTELGPVKKVYTLTEKGRVIIDQIIKQNYESDLKFIDEYQKLIKTFVEYFEKNPEDNSCPQCKTIAPKDALFCPKCGHKLSSNSYNEVIN